MKQAFTIVELLVVVAIICLLIALILPVMSNARFFAYRATCLSNLRETAAVIHAYASDYRGHLPLANATNPRLLRPEIHDAIEQYFEGPYDIFYCPIHAQVDYAPDRTARPDLPYVTPDWWGVRRTWDASHYKIGYVYVANLDDPGCSKFINGDPAASLTDPSASEDPVLFDFCKKRRDGNQEWVAFPHDGISRRVGMNALFGDMHAEWKNFKDMHVEYHYVHPGDLWW